MKKPMPASTATTAMASGSDRLGAVLSFMAARGTRAETGGESNSKGTSPEMSEGDGGDEGGSRENKVLFPRMKARSCESKVLFPRIKGDCSGESVPCSR
jgi:hypothetical protein